MTDTRRKAAEEWGKSAASGDSQTAATIRTIASESHLAGQEYGEQRAVEGIVRWLRGVKVNGIVCAHLNEFAAEMIKRGEWKEESK